MITLQETNYLDVNHQVDLKLKRQKEENDAWWKAFHQANLKRKEEDKAREATRQADLKRQKEEADKAWEAGRPAREAREKIRQEIELLLQKAEQAQAAFAKRVELFAQGNPRVALRPEDQEAYMEKLRTALALAEAVVEADPTYADFVRGHYKPRVHKAMEREPQLAVALIEAEEKHEAAVSLKKERAIREEQDAAHAESLRKDQEKRILLMLETRKKEAIKCLNLRQKELFAQRQVIERDLRTIGLAPQSKDDPKLKDQIEAKQKELSEIVQEDESILSALKNIDKPVAPEARAGKLLNWFADEKVQAFANELKGENPEMTEFEVSGWANWIQTGLRGLSEEEARYTFQHPERIEAEQAVESLTRLLNEHLGTPDQPAYEPAALVAFLREKKNSGRLLEKHEIGMRISHMLEDLQRAMETAHQDDTILYKKQMPGYRHSCGYFSLGIMPEEAKSQLLQNLAADNPQVDLYREMIADDILEAAENGNLPDGLKTVGEGLLQKRTEAEQEVASLARVLNEHLGTPDQPAAYEPAAFTLEGLQDALPDDEQLLQKTKGGMTVSDTFEGLQEAIETLQQTEDDLRDWAQQKETVSAYIEAEIRPDVRLTFLPNGGSGVMAVLAELNHFILNIYSPVDGASKKLTLAYNHTPYDAEAQGLRTLNLLYTPGHYDRLTDHFIPFIGSAVAYEDPFAKYMEKKVKRVNEEAFKQEMLILDEEIAPGVHALDALLKDATEGQEDEKERMSQTLAIQGYMAEVQVLRKRDITFDQAKKEFEGFLADLKDKQATLLKKRTDSRVLQHLIKASSRETIVSKQNGDKIATHIDPKEIGTMMTSILGAVFPKVTYPKDFQTSYKAMIDQIIFDMWDKGYVAFDIRDKDGLYGKVKGADYEKLLDFMGGKGKPVLYDSLGIFLSGLGKTPEPDEIKYYDEMWREGVRILGERVKEGSLKTLTEAGKILFGKREEWLAGAKAKEAGQETTFQYGSPAVGGYTIHLNLSDPDPTKLRHDHDMVTNLPKYELDPSTGELIPKMVPMYDGVSLLIRLNTIHNSIVGIYLEAKSQGEAALKRFFENNYIGYLNGCLDAISQALQNNLIKENLSFSEKLEGLTKDRAIYAVLEAMNPVTPQKVMEEFRALIRKGQRHREGVFEEADIETALEAADDFM